MTARKSLEMVGQDCIDDAKSLDGMPLTGLTMGTRFGQIYAMVKALADSMLEQEDRLDRIEATLDRAEAAVMRGGTP